MVGGGLVAVGGAVASAVGNTVGGAAGCGGRNTPQVRSAAWSADQSAAHGVARRAQRRCD
jgi:hypothetical protein